jgi:hypothetical protein
VVLRADHGAEGALLHLDADRWLVGRDHDWEVVVLPVLLQAGRRGSGLGVLREVQRPVRQQEERHGVPLVHGLDLACLADQALLVCVLDPDHVPVAVQRVRGQSCLLGAEHPAVVARPVPEVRLQPPRHRVGSATGPGPPHELVEHRLVRLCYHGSPSLVEHFRCLAVRRGFADRRHSGPRSVEMDPGGLRRHAQCAEDKQHVPAGRSHRRSRREGQE